MTILCTNRKLRRLIEPGHRRVLFAVTRSNEPLETEHKLSESSMTRETNTTTEWMNQYDVPHRRLSTHQLCKLFEFLPVHY